MRHRRNGPFFFRNMVEFKDGDVGFAAIYAWMTAQVISDQVAVTSCFFFNFPRRFYYVRFSVFEIEIPLVNPLALAAMSVPFTCPTSVEIELGDGLDLFADDALPCVHGTKRAGDGN
ncbi:MAG: hypothetical protein HY782_00890 [Chloroflexi bacterium]|nr:hypothetical protein [Chloroflexota bacterium]